MNYIKTKATLILLALSSLVFLAACGNNTATNPPVVENISVPEAKSIALSMVDNATFHNLELRLENGVEVYDVDIVSDETAYQVLVNAQTGDVLSLSNESLEVPATSSKETTSQTGENETSSTENSNQQAADENGITRERAREIAQAVIPQGRVVEVDRDIERGRFVWHVEIREGGLTHRIYVDRSNGEIVYQEID